MLPCIASGTRSNVFPTDERMGRLAGRLLGDAGGTNSADAMVASEAVLAEADVLTADPDDLRPLLAGFPRTQVIPVRPGAGRGGLTP